MHLSKNTFCVSLLASLLSVGSIYADQQIKFHLPVAVKWGNTMLEPGDYRMEVPSSIFGMQTICMANNHKAVFVLPIAGDATQPAVYKSSLQLVNVDGTYFVQKFSSSVSGRTIFFGIPKSHRNSEKLETREVGSSN